MIKNHMQTITLNADMGEGFGIYDFGNDEGLLNLVDTANVACGFHASDFNHMRRTVQLAKAYGVTVGAHPSLPDRQGFGRREIQMSRQELTDCIIYQVGALLGFLKAENLKLSHIKPHGALYGMAAHDPDVANAIADVALIFGVPIFGMAGTQHEAVYPARGVRLVAEFFPDLDYDADGCLIILPKAPCVDPALAALRTMAAIETGLGKERLIPVATICVHSDRANCVEVATAIAGVIASTNRTNLQINFPGG